MAFWTWIDDSVLTAELLVGALIAAIGATAVEVAQHQAASHIRIRAEWLAPSIRLPLKVLRDTGVVLRAALAAAFFRRFPPSGFASYSVAAGDDSAEGTTRRALILAGTSVAPNGFALGIDTEKGSLLVHHLVMPGQSRRARRR